MKKLLALLVAGLFTATFAQTEINYWLWDASQQPAYEECAAAFTKENPDITVKITQQGWGDYWTGISTGFVSGTAPDVFTNHLAKYPEFAANGQLVDIQPWVERDSVPTDIYVGQLADLWGRDGARYGLPKDWDTIAMVYNKAMLDAAGVTVDDLNSATWNPEDGGTFGEIIAKLSLDAKGNNGLSPDFDPNNVVQYGFLNTNGANPYGQTEWSWLAVSTGWTFNDGLYATKYNYDDPRFIATIQWYADLIKKGFAPKWEEVNGLGASSMFSAQKGALTSDGSWMIGTYLANSDFEMGFASIPAGPEGRKSMFNGLADSIWVGSQHQEESWKWVKFLASPACEEVVGKYAVVFPAIPSAVDIAVAAQMEKGVNVAAFSDLTKTEGATFLFPVTDYASQVTDIMTKAMQSILIGESDAATTLPKANEEVNALFQ
jgi:multiple sugar transport system substrate-binding protein